MLMVFLVKGRVQPWTTTTYKGKFAEGTKYKVYQAFRDRVTVAVNETMQLEGWTMSDGVPLRIAVVYNAGDESPGLHQRDLTNITKGTEDGAQHKAYRNDAWVDQEAAMRAKVDREEDRLLLFVQPISEGPERFSDWLLLVEVAAQSRGFVLV